MNLVQDQDLSLPSLALSIRETLENKGFILIPQFAKDIEDLDELKEVYLDLCQLVGVPISHDTSDSIIWDIKMNEKSRSFVKTYSEHSHEAEMHTDSQYSEYPEDFFGLLTIKKANCGGGLSYVLSLDDILEEFQSNTKNRRYEEILRNTNYPFIVPNVFKKDNRKEREYNFGPILRDNEIRFRVDTFEKAILLNPELCTTDQVEAFKALKKIILNSEKTQKFYLEDRDLIFINNKTMLHGRSAFEDPERHLLRIRMNRH
ncbi:MAG: TauD/TfdA family dioxygenase [Cytophagales bacterium]|nr:TauD/TfdA family dioxygenase [Cytophagales bacterium]